MKKILILLLLSTSVKATSQQCNCYDNFNFMARKIKQNYVGYKYKIPNERKELFAKFTDSLIEVSKKTNLLNCLSVMQSWLNSFNDEHVYVFMNNDSTAENIIRNFFSNTPQHNLSKKQFLSYLKINKNRIDPIEGIWEDENKNYTIGIIKKKKLNNKTQFVGFIIKADSVFWMPKQIKLIIEKNNLAYNTTAYYTGNHSTRKPIIHLAGNKLILDSGWNIFIKKDLNESLSTISKPITQIDKNMPNFTVLDNNTCLLTVPSFSLVYKSHIDSLLLYYDTVLKKSLHLIIDLRNNGGGSVLCFEKIIPYLYTNPIITKGSSVLATEDNIRDYYALYDYPNISDSMKNVFKKEAEILKNHIGELYPLWPSDTLILNNIYTYPKTISILVNERCASSAELFLLKAKQSTKVKLYGKHTMGAVDYSDAVTASFPCPLYKIRYSSSISNRIPEQPIDNIGIIPDIEIEESESDWIKFVQYQKTNF
jgi:hypothetical protein